MGEVKLDGYLCDRCSHTWVSRNGFAENVSPKVCPKCKSPYWNVPRKNRKVKPVEVKREIILFPPRKKEVSEKLNLFPPKANG